jgi:hypothetical protein
MAGKISSRGPAASSAALGTLLCITPLLWLTLAGGASQAAPKQTMVQAAEALDVCRRIAKPDRDQQIGEQAAQAWLTSAPGAAGERLDPPSLLRAMVEAYGQTMQKEGQLIAMGCSQGVLDRCLPLNWSAFHQGAMLVLQRNGMGDLLRPGGR